MAKRKHTTEQIIRKLREAEIELAKGQSIKLACKKLGVTARALPGRARRVARPAACRPPGN